MQNIRDEHKQDPQDDGPVPGGPSDQKWRGLTAAWGYGLALVVSTAGAEHCGGSCAYCVGTAVVAARWIRDRAKGR